MTLSLSREIASLDTVAPYTSARCAVISPVVNFRASRLNYGRSHMASAPT